MLDLGSVVDWVLLICFVVDAGGASWVSGGAGGVWYIRGIRFDDLLR